MRRRWYRGKWYAVWTEGGQTKRLSLRTTDSGLADQRLRDLQKRPVGETVGALMEVYLEDLDHRAGRPDRPRDAWKALKPHFAGLHPSQVDRAACRLYARARRAKGRKNGTINKELGVLRAGLRWHDKNTPAVIELPPAPPPKERCLSRDEYEALLSACEAPHVRLFVILALATAGRATAILELTWDRVDLQRGRIYLSDAKPGQTRKGRATVPITKRAREALETARDFALTDFVIEYGGKPLGSIKKAFGTACKRAGLEGVSPHVLRHTAAVWMAEAGRPMSEIARYLGHEDSRLTERVYAKYGPDYLREAAEALE